MKSFPFSTKRKYGKSEYSRALNAKLHVSTPYEFLIEHDNLEHSEILSWSIAKYGKIIFNGLFQKESVFKTLVPFY